MTIGKWEFEVKSALIDFLADYDVAECENDAVTFDQLKYDLYNYIEDRPSMWTQECIQFIGENWDEAGQTYEWLTKEMGWNPGPNPFDDSYSFATLMIEYGLDRLIYDLDGFEDIRDDYTKKIFIDKATFEQLETEIENYKF